MTTTACPPPPPLLDDHCNRIVAHLTRQLATLAEQRYQHDASHDFLVQTPHPILLDLASLRE